MKTLNVPLIYLKQKEKFCNKSQHFATKHNTQQLPCYGEIALSISVFTDIPSQLFSWSEAE
ncbi:MAG: hypothetical protein JST82_06150 [Bacteroidetes bacterium]|nr:hypothetical protein [Bacteroidota bacterium]